MLIEVGPRTIGKCELRYPDCNGKSFSIVKKVLLAKDGHTAWVCHSCMMEKLKFDREETNLRPNPLKEINP
ncbi:MAG: hypothetical protein ACJAT2_000213 [Bacteriovoracaceae bacterium]|jgi:hypothetical protein